MCSVIIVLLADLPSDEVVSDCFHVDRLRGLAWELMGLVVKNFSGSWHVGSYGCRS